MEQFLDPSIWFERRLGYTRSVATASIGKPLLMFQSKYKKSNVSSVGPFSETNVFLSDEGPTLETLDFALYIGSTPTFLYFDLYLNTAYAAHYVYFIVDVIV